MHPILRAGLAGMRQNLLPGLVLWAVALALVLAYYLVPAARPAYDAVQGWRQAWGFGFSALAAALFGAVLPFAVLALLGRVPAGRGLGILLFLVAHWTYRGMEVDAFYRLQAWVFGDGTDAPTVAKKVVVDQFVYSAFWTGWTAMVLYRWKDCGFSWSRARATIDRAFWTREVPTAVVSLWGVWIPAVSIIYCLPSPLQIPLFNIVLCFWVLLIEVVAKRVPAVAAAEAQLAGR